MDPKRRERLSRFHYARMDRIRATRNRKRSQEREVIDKVQKACLSAGTFNPPRDLARLARNIGIDEVRVHPLANRADITLEGHRLVIELSDQLTEFDRRFSLGHEIGHMLLEGDRIKALFVDRARQAVSRHAYIEMERKCDLAAAELLLPEEWLVDQLDLHRPSLAAMKRIADAAQVPVDFVIDRALRAGIIQAQAIWWRLKEDRLFAWRVLPDEGGLADAWVDIEPASYSSILGAALQDIEIVSGNLTFTFRGSPFTSHWECLALTQDEVVSFRSLTN